MSTQINLGDTVALHIDGHSANNGAVIPATSTVTIDNNDPTVATWPNTVAVPTDIQQIVVPVTVLAGGSTDAHITVTDPQGNKFEATATLVVAVVAPGLASITAEFVRTN